MTNKDYPLISVITVTTANSVKWLEHAIRMFQAQTYPNVELIIVMEHSSNFRLRNYDKIADNIYMLDIGSPLTLSIGAKRNLAVSVACGELITIADIDDWFGPDRLWNQSVPILSDDADMTAMKMNLVYHVQTAKLWRMSDALHEKHFPHDVDAGTLMYRKSITRAGTVYPNESRRKNTWFLDRLIYRGGRLVQIVDPHSYIRVRHNDNVIPELEHQASYGSRFYATEAKEIEFGPPDWTEERVADYFSPDELAFYEGMRRELRGKND